VTAVIGHRKKKWITGSIGNLNKKFATLRHAPPQPFQKSAGKGDMFQRVNNKDTIYFPGDFLKFPKDPGTNPGFSNRPDTGGAFLNSKNSGGRGFLFYLP